MPTDLSSAAFVFQYSGRAVDLLPVRPVPKRCDKTPCPHLIRPPNRSTGSAGSLPSNRRDVSPPRGRREIFNLHLDRTDHFIYLVVHIWPERQPYDSVTHAVGVLERSYGPSVFHPGRRTVEGNVVEDRGYAELLESRDQCLPSRQIRHQEIIHVTIVLTVGWDNGPTKQASLFQ